MSRLALVDIVSSGIAETMAKVFVRVWRKLDWKYCETSRSIIRTPMALSTPRASFSRDGDHVRKCTAGVPPASAPK